MEKLAVEKKYFEKVLDDIVSLNSLFTVAVFIGLSYAQPGQVQSLADDPSCHPDTTMRRRLVYFEIASFSCFIFAGFLGKAVKIFLYTSEKQEGKGKPLRKWKSLLGFYSSIYGTMLGCLLLLLAMIEVIQIKLGRLSCHGKYTVTTVAIMVGIIGLSLLIFFFAVTNGLRIAYAELKKNKEKKIGHRPACA
ncbi:uncharacterized protein LOC115755297 [Rhodamnia argentea]|uniref:Uncharacterized protein LOC115755297 n=1 Tax=Rhodamnia argentea TaxID=178133 RepID=A0A8B8QVX1_9MYRT|nr:uncharacterized protein LOC115755297 [Rhodamnia argentea]